MSKTKLASFLFVIIGYFDLLASSNATYGTGEWAFAFVEVYVFVSFIYFIFVFGLSRNGASLNVVCRLVSVRRPLNDCTK